MSTTDKAIEILGYYANHNRTGELLTRRINNLAEFIDNYGQYGEVKILVNNNWSSPPHPTKLAKYQRIGGTTYSYQLWAVIYK